MDTSELLPSVITAKRGRYPFVIEHQVQFHRSFGPFVLRPVEHLRAQIYAAA